MTADTNLVLSLRLSRQLHKHDRTKLRDSQSKTPLWVPLFGLFSEHQKGTDPYWFYLIGFQMETSFVKFYVGFTVQHTNLLI